MQLYAFGFVCAIEVKGAVLIAHCLVSELPVVLCGVSKSPSGLSFSVSLHLAFLTISERMNSLNILRLKAPRLYR